MALDKYVSVWAAAKETAREFVIIAMPIQQAIELQQVDLIHYDEYTNEWVGIDSRWSQDFTDWRMLLQVPGAFVVNQRRAN